MMYLSPSSSSSSGLLAIGPGAFACLHPKERGCTREVPRRDVRAESTRERHRSVRDAYEKNVADERDTARALEPSLAQPRNRVCRALDFCKLVFQCLGHRKCLARLNRYSSMCWDILAPYGIPS